MDVLKRYGSLDGLREAAEAGDSIAQSELAVRYRRGDGLPKDPVQALIWFRKAAEQREPSAQDRIGVCYATGMVFHKIMQRLSSGFA